MASEGLRPREAILPGLKAIETAERAGFFRRLGERGQLARGVRAERAVHASASVEFGKARERLRSAVGPDSNPRTIEARLRAGAASLEASRAALSASGRRLSGLEERQMALAGECRNHARRLEGVEGLIARAAREGRVKAEESALDEACELASLERNDSPSVNVPLESASVQPAVAAEIVPYIQEHRQSVGEQTWDDRGGSSRFSGERGQEGGADGQRSRPPEPERHWEDLEIWSSNGRSAVEIAYQTRSGASLRLTVSRQGEGAVSVRLAASTAGEIEALRTERSRIIASLSRAGIRVERFEVDRGVFAA